MATLYIVSTPIGNLGDITYRASEGVKEVNLFSTSADASVSEGGKEDEVLFDSQYGYSLHRLNSNW